MRMTDLLSPASIAFRADGTPYSVLHDDVYHSAAGGFAQARHVFLDGNGLPRRWAHETRFTVVETGFGMGVNFLATWSAWRADPARCTQLEFISIEKYPMKVDDLRRALDAVIDEPAYRPLAAALCDAWPALIPGSHRVCFDHDNVRLTLVFADALEALPALDIRADAMYLDGFSPLKNPELWSPGLMDALARLAHARTTLSTYTSAGTVKRALRQAGFEVGRKPGFGWKRHMLVGHYAGDV